MKYLFIFIFFTTMCSYGQNNLVFDKKVIQSEDRWVAFPADSTGAYICGFIYIDSQAGLTLNYEGSFKIDESGKFNLQKKEVDGYVKYRLTPNNLKVAFIPSTKFSELGINEIPDWLKFYKEDEGTVERQYKWGYMYNGWGECEKALEFLNKAYKLNRQYEGLRVELAYSYNCLGNYNKAIKYLMESMREESVTAYLIKELIYSQAKNGDLVDAENTFDLFDSKISDKAYRPENAYNILQGYYLLKDIENFNRWLQKTDLENNERFRSYVKQMINELK
ncbi:MAG: tetratricopeptide repeat protein [Flavobacteriaceae bacterium]|nr:tetratricopeptide repeat protein [Flavobacteriaceae bacterium]